MLTVCIACAIGCLMSYSCRKDKKVKAGKGGNGTLRVMPRHHDKPITSCKIYVTYDATSSPDHYDDSVTCVSVNDTLMAIFPGLNNGNYYLTGKGYDASGPYDVHGGISFKLEKQEAERVYLPVGEESNQ